MTTYNLSDTIESLPLPKVGKFDLRAYAVFDEHSKPADFDCYTLKQLNAWHRDEWFFVGVYVVASVHGTELGESSLWGIEYGAMPITTENDTIESTTDIDLTSLAESILPDLIAETIQEAEGQLSELMALAGVDF